VRSVAEGGSPVPVETLVEKKIFRERR
jgi:hypothetical protein